jgi:hypothetical protein
MKKKITGILVCMVVLATASLLAAETATLRPDRQTAASLRGAKESADYRPVEAVAEEILAGPVDRSKDFCDLYGTPAVYIYNFFYGLEWYANYQDPEEFGCVDVWPFEVTEICFDMTVGDSLTFEVQGFVLENVGQPGYPSPGATLCETPVYQQNLPDAGDFHICLPMTEPCCVNEPYFAAVYFYTDFSQMADKPDPLAENDPSDVWRSYCDYGVGWIDLVLNWSWPGEMILNSVGYTSPQNDCPKLDFGDAPDPTYPTLLANDGARHIIVPNVHLGANIDQEVDGQPNASALGDDSNPLAPDDEDGVVFTSLAVAGNPVTVKVTASVAGFLDAWVDFNVDGDWDDAGEQIFASEPLAAGVNNLTFNVPITTPAGITYSRFRFSTAGGLSYTGLASDGEVEDYRVFVLEPITDIKMHHPQWPDLDKTGMDVGFSYTTMLMLGDDWLCTKTGPVTDIHFWGSFESDILPAEGAGNLSFGVEIYSDNQYTHTPEDMLWSRGFFPGQYTVHQVADNNPEDWFDPYTGEWYNDDHLQIYQYDFFIEEDHFEQDSGTVYWLTIMDISGYWGFGWKTTEYSLRYREDAVYSLGIEWVPMEYPPGHEYGYQSLDLAFVITGHEGVPPVICGDVNNDGIVNIGDVVYMVSYLYKSGPAPIPQTCVGDVNNDDIVNVGDIVYLVAYLYKGGPVPNPNCCNPAWKDSGSNPTPHGGHRWVK